MPPMTPRERVLTALNHEEPDRVPLILGGDLTTGIHARAYQRLKAHLEIEAEDRYLYDWPELGAADPDEQVLQALGSDGRGVFDRFPQATRSRNAARPPHSPYVNDWGVGSPEVSPGSYYPAIHPLANASTLAEIQDYPHWPDMADPARVAGVAKRAAALAQANYAVIASPWLLFPLERAVQMQGMETFFIHLASNPEFASALLRHILELCKTLMAQFLQAAGEHIDIIVTGDDLGTQESLLVSPRMYRRLIKPIHAEWLAFIRARTKAKIYFHSDGDVFPLLDDFVEIGVEILNPIQASGKMADIAALKQRYGKNLSFCGGLDTQHLLPHGSPEDVRREVKRLVETLGPGGGYLLAPVHSITNDVPPENIVAMAEAVRD